MTNPLFNDQADNLREAIDDLMYLYAHAKTKEVSEDALERMYRLFQTARNELLVELLGEAVDYSSDLNDDFYEAVPVAVIKQRMVGDDGDSK